MEYQEIHYIIDNNYNKVDLQLYTKEQAIDMLNSLINCSDCLNCSNCVNSTNLKNCINCRNSTFCYDSKDLENCCGLENQENSKNIQNY